MPYKKARGCVAKYSHCMGVCCVSRLVEGDKFFSNRGYPHSLVDVVAPNSCLEDEVGITHGAVDRQLFALIIGR